MSVRAEDVCVRCDAEFAADDAQVTIHVESSDLGCFRDVEKTHFLCGQCYSDYLAFVFTEE